MTDTSAASAGARDEAWAHWLVLAAVSLTFELAFVGTNLNLVDEGWPLYAAMQLHLGGTLYDDTFFVFPPGHLLPAWIGYGLAPPGVYVARLIYAAFDVALVLALYALGRRVMPARFAFVGALLLAVAAEDSHHKQLLFGYRFLVFGVLALLLFARSLERRDRFSLFGAGCLTGVALAFRIDPPFSAALAVALGTLAATRDPRRWLRDGLVYTAGFALTIAPVLAWLLSGVSADVLWREVVVRPLVMTDLQSLPVPDWRWWPEALTRRYIHEWFVAIQFRAWTLLYLVYFAALVRQAVRAWRSGRPGPDPLLVAIVVFGGTFFLRAFGRADSPHLYSALPPVCLLLAHAAWKLIGTSVPGESRLPRRALAPLAVAGVALWVFLMGSDRIFWPGHLGREPLAVLGGQIGVKPDTKLLRVDAHVRTIGELSSPGDTILDLSASSLFYVLADRRGPGYADVIMPGTFLDEAEERRFVARLAAHPPALVIFPGWLFDERKDRAVQASAPRVWAFVKERYQRIGPYERFVLMAPKSRLQGRGVREGQDPPGAADSGAGAGATPGPTRSAPPAPAPAPTAADPR